MVVSSVSTSRHLRAFVELCFFMVNECDRVLEVASTWDAVVLAVAGHVLVQLSPAAAQYSSTKTRQ